MHPINYKILKLHNPWLRESYLTNKLKKKYFIEIPQKGAASDLDLSHKLKQRIKESKADIFLLGIGSMKIYLLPLLQDINKIFIDVGCGIDALAGVVSQDRPYFSRWVNYQFENKSFDFSVSSYFFCGNKIIT